MRSWSFFPIVAGLTLALVVSGCEGPTGPEGSAGEQGPEGPQGPPGTANVITGSVTLEEADWSDDLRSATGVHISAGIGFGKPARYLDIEVTDITADVIADGAVLVYMETVRDDGSLTTLYTQLPHRFLFSLGTVAWHFDHELTEGNIQVLFFIEDLENPSNTVDPLGPTQATREYRWVILPPAATTAEQVQALPIEVGPDAVVEALEDRGFGLAPGN